MGKKGRDFFIDLLQAAVLVRKIQFSLLQKPRLAVQQLQMWNILCILGDKGEGAFWFPFRGAIAMEQVRQLSLHGP